MNVFFKKVLKVITWAACIIAALLTTAELILSSQLTTKIVNRYAKEYIDGTLNFGKVSASILKRFPAATVTFEDFSITSPTDTLASFKRFSASTNIGQLIFGRINIPSVELVKPRIFAHSYDDGSTNWDIFRIENNADSSKIESETKIPKISIGTIRLTEHPHIVYTDSRDTLSLMVDVKEIVFDGRLNTANRSKNRIGLTLDSMFVAGRTAQDTIAVGLDLLRIHEHRKHIDLDAKAKTMVATRTFGRMFVPININGTLHFPKDSILTAGIHDLQCNIAHIPISGDAILRFMEGKTGIEGRLEIRNCKLDELKEQYIKKIIPGAADISTDASINAVLSCNSEYTHGSGHIPQCNLSIDLPEATVRHNILNEQIRMKLTADIESGKNGKINVSVKDISVHTDGLDMNATASASDVLSGDPLIKVNGRLEACLDSLVRFIPDTLDMQANGILNAHLNGKTRLSALNIYNFSSAELLGEVAGERIFISIPKDTLNVYIDGLAVNIGPEEKTSRIDSTKSFKLMGITAELDKADISYGSELSLKGESIYLSAKNSTENSSDTNQVNLLGGRLNAKTLSMKDEGGNRIRISETQNGFQIMPKKGNPKIPVLTLSSRNKRISLISEVNRAILSDASIRATAAMNSIERRQKIREFMDSIAKANPDISRDSLRRRMSSYGAKRELPEWLKEEDFRKQDISIKLDESIKKYFREWDAHGSITIRRGMLMTPYLPLRNRLQGCGIDITNDRIAIDSLTISAGNSSISANGSLGGLKRAILGKGIIKVDLDINADSMDINELSRTINTGLNFNPDNASDKMRADVSDEEFLEIVTSDTLATSTQSALLVIPANINADISLHADNITYSDLKIYELTSTLMMKERCVQMTNTLATSNMGAIDFKGFYSTRTKKDIRTGFNIDFKDITADKAIALMPAVDTIMPLLKSFSGNLNCELAATAKLDTNMNILTPSINGVIRICGDDLTLSNSEMFSSLAKKLKFSDRKQGTVKHMTVEGMIKDNILEVFPFVLSLDRYTLALSGKQNLDMSYRYHASLIKSPLLLKIGVDIYGEDFDNMKFKIGKPKYKNENVPVFTTVINQTKINLAESIMNIFAKGVEAAIAENERQDVIAEHKRNIGYVNAADQALEELSEDEQKTLEIE